MNRLMFAGAGLLLGCLFLSPAGNADADSFYGLQGPQGQGQGQGRTGPRPSDGEIAAAKKINDAVDLPAKLKAADEYMKKYSKGVMRPRVAFELAEKIAAVTDIAQKTAHAEAYLAIFTDAKDALTIYPVLVDAYVQAKRFDDAFRAGALAIAKNPDDVEIRTQLTIVGTEQLKQQNPAYATIAMEYGAKAIELMEADRKPADFEQALWARFKSDWLPHLYQSTAIISLASKNNADAKARLEKAAALKPDDPFTHLLIGSLINQDYTEKANRYKGMKPGPEADAVLKSLHEDMDKIIDCYARAVGLSEGLPAYQKLHDEVLLDLTSYYKYRHNGSDAGMKELIEKYKRPANLALPSPSPQQF